MLACGYEVYVASEFHGLTRSIIKSVNFRVHPLQKNINPLRKLLIKV